jgi:TetR/AcrR family transcriptional regulator
MPTSSTNRGRPKDPQREAQVKDSLIQAANQALKNKLYTEISIREIAAMADVNSAMISYHFGGKEGLFFALIQKGVGEENLNELGALTTDNSLSPKEKLRILMTVFISTHQNYPWLSRLIVDQIIFKKGKLRDLFIEHIISQNERVIEQLIKQFIAEGYFRADLNSEFTRTSLMSLLAFPFIVAPMIEQAFGLDYYTQDIDTWVDHTLNLFLNGCKAQADSQEL